jgi:stage II sporulation protein P
MSKTGLIISILLISLIAFLPVGYAHERSDGGYYNILDEGGNVVYVTGWKIDVGDQFLTAENKRYEITSVKDDTAYAKLLGQVNLSQMGVQYTPVNWKSTLFSPVAKAQDKPKVAIYHTHSDESYVPSDGTDSSYGNGGIYQVGDAFASALKNKGLDVIHSTTKHDPHDDMAYERSRRTAMELLKQQPSAMFDVHRDSTPPEVYQTTIDGEKITKVQLVVGKYGPTGKQIEDYALQIKAAADQQHPGLIKGIFFAKGGDYNQDLLPRSMLLEVGSHTNDKESAEKGVALFADVVPTILGATSPEPAAQNGTAGLGTAAAGPSGAAKSIGWIIGLLVVGAAAFLLISTGSIKEAKAKLKQFTSTEFANFLGPKIRNKAKKKKQPDEEGE